MKSVGSIQLLSLLLSSALALPLCLLSASSTAASPVPLEHGQTKSGRVWSDNSTCHEFITSEGSIGASGDAHVMFHRSSEPITAGPLMIQVFDASSMALILTTTAQQSVVVPASTSQFAVHLCTTDDMQKGPRTDLQYYLNWQYFCDEHSFPHGDDNQLSCAPCPARSRRESDLPLEKGIDACICSEGTYRVDEGSNFNCTDCPPGALCSDGSILTTRAAHGYFPMSNGTESDIMPMFLRCPLGVACAHREDELCSEGYTGYLCGQCDNDYYRMGSYCFKCSAKGASITLVTLMTFVLVILPLLFFLLGQMWYWFGSFPILINFIQVTVLFARFHLKWPTSLTFILQIFSVFNFNTEPFQLDCLGPWPLFAKTMFQTYTGLIFTFPFLLVVLITFIVFKAKRFQNWSPFYRVLGLMSNSLWGMVLFAYTMLATWSMGIFSCDFGFNSGDETPVHLTDSSVQCTFSDNGFLVVAIFSIIALLLFTIGIPALTAFVTSIKGGHKIIHLVKARRAGSNSSEASMDKSNKYLSEKEDSIGNRVYRQMFGIFFVHYKERTMWWELVILLRKLLVVIMFTFLPLYPTGAIFASIVIIMVSLLILTYTSPYVHTLHNALEFAMLILQFVILIGCLTLFASGYDNPLTEQYDNFVMIVVLIAFLAGVALGIVATVLEVLISAIRSIKERRRRILEENIDKDIGDSSFDITGSDLILSQEHASELEDNSSTQRVLREHGKQAQTQFHNYQPNSFSRGAPPTPTMRSAPSAPPPPPPPPSTPAPPPPPPSAPAPSPPPPPSTSSSKPPPKGDNDLLASIRAGKKLSSVPRPDDSSKLAGRVL